MERRDFLISGGLATLTRKRKPVMVWSVQSDTIFILQPGEAILVYNGPPAAGNLVTSIAPTSSTDSFGNVYDQGIGIYAKTGAAELNMLSGPTLADQFQITQTAASGNVDIFHAVQEAGHTGRIRIRFGIVGTDTGIQVGSGLGGKYYAEEVALSAQVIASATAATTLINLVAVSSETDYGSAFNLVTGVWTCPVTGRYDFTVSCGFIAWIANSRMILYMSVNGTTQTDSFGTFDAQNTTGRAFVTVARKKMTLNDTVTFRVAQVTAANQTIDSVASPKLCYITAGRCL